MGFCKEESDMTSASVVHSATTQNPAIVAVPAFQDNYIWLIHDGTHAVVVDPGDAAPIMTALDEAGLTLTAILLTHHHADHVGGVPAVTKKFAVPVYGPQEETIQGVTHRLKQGDRVELRHPAMSLTVLDVPGHTRGHIAYVEDRRGILFCGDTLFGAGCGRLFEGTPAQMIDSLAKLAALPDETLVCCAHEYTLSNLRFALAVEPDNPALQHRMQRDRSTRDQGLPTLPSTIGEEKATNPFLRYDEAQIVERVAMECSIASTDATSVFAALREWKNKF